MRQATATGTSVTAPAITSNVDEPLHTALPAGALEPLSVMLYPLPAGIPSISAEIVELRDTSIWPALAKLGPVMPYRKVSNSKPSGAVSASESEPLASASSPGLAAAGVAGA
jgi:hypothetical protein